MLFAMPYTILSVKNNWLVTTSELYRILSERCNEDILAHNTIYIGTQIWLRSKQ